MKLRELQAALEELIFVGQARREGIFFELHRQCCTADELAVRMDMDPRAVRVLLEALTEMGYLARRDGVYSVPAEIHARLVDREGDLYEGDFWNFLLYLINPWMTLPHVLRTGTPDESSYAGFSMEDFIRGMNSPWKKRVVPEIVDRCMERHPGAKRVADIGGAPGAVAREFARRGVGTLVYDLEKSLAVLGGELARVENIEVIAGDATEWLPPGPFDIAFLGNLCHGQSPEDNGRIIAMCREILNPGGLLVVFDNVRGVSSLGARLALHMITQSPRGNVYSKDDYFRWIGMAGFGEPELHRLSDPAWQLIVARA